MLDTIYDLNQDLMKQFPFEVFCIELHCLVLPIALGFFHRELSTSGLPLSKPLAPYHGLSINKVRTILRQMHHKSRYLIHTGARPDICAYKSIIEQRLNTGISVWGDFEQQPIKEIQRVIREGPVAG
jgi:hypothetical protein